MKKLYICSILLAVLWSAEAAAQTRQLICRKVSDDTVINLSKTSQSTKNSAEVIIKCPADISLAFNLIYSPQEELKVSREELPQQNMVRYRLSYVPFHPSDDQEWDNMLTIVSDGYAPVVIKVSNKELTSETFELIERDSDRISLYVKAMNKAADLYQEGLYAEAKDQYALAVTLAESDPAEIKIRIAQIDSIMLIKGKAEAYFSNAQYYNSASLYGRIYSINPSDKAVFLRLKEAYANLQTACDNNFAKASQFFKSKRYSKANKLYRKIIANKCDANTAATARAQIDRIELILINTRPQVILYEFNDRVPFGISYGTYRRKKGGGYVSVHFNSELFQFRNLDKIAGKKPEIDFSFGWTFILGNPIWMFLGPGYTMVGEVTDANADDPHKEPSLRFKAKHAISPEIGLLAKIGPIALRYTFQYRIPINKNDNKYIGPMRHTVGIGLAFPRRASRSERSSAHK